MEFILNNSPLKMRKIFRSNINILKRKEQPKKRKAPNLFKITFHLKFLKHFFKMPVLIFF